MSKNISISDEVYRKLKREKGNRSFSDLINARLEGSGKLADVTGDQVLDPETYERLKTDIRSLSDGTVERLDDETR